MAVDFLSGQGGSGFTALNLGTGAGHSVQQIVAAVERVTEHSVPLRITTRRPGDPPSLVADPSRAQTVLHWTAKRSLEDIVASAWKWLNSSRRQQVGAGAAIIGEGPK